jgi:hypothetical protein
VVSRRPTSIAELEGEPGDPEYVEEEQRESPVSLKDKQIRMEQQVYRIWTCVPCSSVLSSCLILCVSVLSAFEESSAACISDMLRQVSNGQYLDAIRMAEKFILHVEVLFATIDDLEYQFYRLNMKGSFGTLPNLRFIMTDLGSQACPTFAKPACCVAKPWSCSHCCPIRRKRDLGGWA